MFSKIERGDRCVRRKQIIVIAHLLQIDETELEMLCLTGKLTADTDSERRHATQAF